MGVLPPAKENTMTNEQKANVANNIREQLSEGFEVAEVACATILDLLDENPQVVENIGQLLAKYWGVFRPMVNEANEDAIRLRVNQYLGIKEVLPHLSDDQIIRLVTGC
jgi:hypothetical protein